MKKIKLNTAKLQLNKERITELNNVDTSHILGGGFPTTSQGDSCGPFSCGDGSNTSCGGCSTTCPIVINNPPTANTSFGGCPSPNPQPTISK